LNSKVFRTKLGIEPICLFFGDRSKTNMSEEFGKVIEVPIMKEWPLIIQITWSKFFWTSTEPDTTWLIGDMDMFPLATDWLTSAIAHIPENDYAHLDADGITQLNGTKYTWSNKIINRDNQKDLGHDTNLPAQYHCAKGRVMKNALCLEDNFQESIKHIVESKRYNGERGYRVCDPIEQHNLWCAEELRSTRFLRQSIFEGKVNFHGFFLKSGVGRTDGNHVHSSMYNEDTGSYNIDEERMKEGQYKNLHAVRPFAHFLSPEICQRRMKANEDLLRKAGMLD
jgi:hypothetical protein